MAARYIHVSCQLVASQIDTSTRFGLICGLIIIELLFVFVEAVFVAPRSEELGIAT